MNNPFAEQQEQLFKTWQENVSKLPGVDAYKEMMEKVLSVDAYKEMFQNIPDATNYWETFSSLNDYWKNFQSMMPNASEQWKKFAEAMPSFNESWQNFIGLMPNADAFAGLWPYKIPGMEVYTKIFDMWKDMDDPANFVQNFQKKYMELSQEMLKGFLPDEVAKNMEKPMQLMQTCVDFYENIMSPWMQIDETIMQRIAGGDISAYTPFFKEFGEKYEETFDKLFNMMGMGLNRESNEDQLKAISAYIKAMFATGEMMSLVMNTCSESMTAMLERYQEDLSQGKMISTFREFYDLWYQVTEDMLINLFNTEEFSKAFCDFSEKYSQYMSAMNKLNERALANLPIPTNKDMKSLYKTVYDLRKEVRDLRRELNAAKKAEPATKASASAKQ